MEGGRDAAEKRLQEELGTPADGTTAVAEPAVTPAPADGTTAVDEPAAASAPADGTTAVAEPAAATTGLAGGLAAVVTPEVQQMHALVERGIKGEVPLDQVKGEVSKLMTAHGDKLDKPTKEFIAKVVADPNFAKDPKGARLLGALWDQTPAAKELIDHYTSEGDPNPAGSAWSWYENAEPWAKAATLIGLPLTLLGIGVSLFGGSSLIGMIMSALGLGVAAIGQTGEGGLLQNTGFGRGVQSLLPMLQGLIGGGGDAPAAGAPAAGAPAAGAPGGKVKSAPAALVGDLNNDGDISKEEMRALIGDPNLLARVKNLSPSEVGRFFGTQTYSHQRMLLGHNLRSEKTPQDVANNNASIRDELTKTVANHTGGKSLPPEVMEALIERLREAYAKGAVNLMPQFF